VAVGETHALRGELVDGRGGDFSAFLVIRGNVAVAEVVGVDEDDVGFFRGAEERGSG
jgi:hypothetical protein